MAVITTKASQDKCEYFAKLWERVLSTGVNTLLDVGAGENPLMFATHVIDYMTYNERGPSQGFAGKKNSFTDKTWNETDFYKMPWNYPDKFFDFVNCTQTLEDVRDPISMCKEMIRVGKTGFIQCPNIISELVNNFWHHRWYVRFHDKKLQFLHKSHIVTMTEEMKKIIHEIYTNRVQESKATSLEWIGSFEVEEIYCKTEKEYLETVNNWINENVVFWRGRK